MSLDSSHPSVRATIFFERRELDALMQLYGRKVAAGEWRDYALDGLSDCAVFSVFERAAEQPLFRIEKRPAMARRQGAWAVIGRGGIVLRRGQELSQVLRLFDCGRLREVD